ncbi:MAG: c-type cytochrome [Pirellulaceae bacterium]|nr:c-type cytochrome [Pirellulaceae bacterium]
MVPHHLDVPCSPTRKRGKTFYESATLALLLWSLAATPIPAQQPATIDASSNTQPESVARLSAAVAAAGMRLPAGFAVDVFASEPQVQQPIAMTFDARGRLWVAENYTYAEREANYDLRYRDRIVILADTDGDGRADQRRVFWDQAQRLTSVEVGFGGVWALCPPHLLFIPDRDADDVPDGEPQVVLDGWDASEARHNFVNGLKWGPDGWLYGRNGILATSRIGVPGCSDLERQPMNCGIWRFHPVQRRFEVVCHGTTNPWGSDWDRHGQMFFINTVIGHLWHAVPGAHLERMYGEDLNPYVYELIGQTADHVHWDAGREKWSDVRNQGVSEASSRLGGGHAHSGLMIYQGDQWPAEYRGQAFTVNLHGLRVNRDRLQRDGATYTGRHEPDFLTVADPWFRGLELLAGPDGAVYLMDWSDIGECHENDGVHRTSGRIYRIRHGQSRGATADLSQAADDELVRLQRHANEWHARQARQQLQQRAAAGADLSEAARQLHLQYASETDEVHQLRQLWCLHAIGALEAGWLLEQLAHPSEHVRVWAIQLLVETSPVAQAVAEKLASLAERETSGLVLTYLASALQRLPHDQRWELARRLVGHEQFADDRTLPLMIWYGVEPIVAGAPERAAELVSQSRMPRVNRLVARRVASLLDQQPQAADALTRQAATSFDAAQRQAVVRGMAEALRGWLRAPQPAGWPQLAATVQRHDPVDVRDQLREVSLVFGDGRALDELRRMVGDGSLPLETRRSAIRALADARSPDLPQLVSGLLADRELGVSAVRALGVSGSDDTAGLLLSKYGQMRTAAREATIEVLASRPATASVLLAAVAAGTVRREEVSPFVLRQMQLLGDESLSDEVARLWPDLRLLAEDKLAQIAEWRQRLSAADLSTADAARGRLVFREACGKCHKLFGDGGAIGPDLTGAQRTNVNYWLENIFDPSGQVAASFRMSVVVLADGRVLNGVLGGESGRTVSLQTPQEKLTIDRDAVEQIQSSNLSLMPDGLLNNLRPEQVLDLFAYLMAAGPPVGTVQRIVTDP